METTMKGALGTIIIKDRIISQGNMVAITHTAKEIMIIGISK